MDKMTVEQIDKTYEKLRHFLWLERDEPGEDYSAALTAMRDLAKFALTPPQDVAGLCEELRGPVLEHTQRFVNRAFNNHDRPMPQLSIPADPARDSDLIVSRGILKAANALLSLSARNRELEAGLKPFAGAWAAATRNNELTPKFSLAELAGIAGQHIAATDFIRAANLQGNGDE